MLPAVRRIRIEGMIALFGYITINSEALSDEEKARYRTYYCGLCRALNQKYGTLSRLTLSNDMTFLGLTLSSLYEPAALESAGVCPVHPLRRQGYLKSAALDYAADMNILLSWYVNQDHVLDDRSANAGLTLRRLRPHYERLSQQYPEKCAEIESCMERIHVLEAQSSVQLDSLCQLSGRILGEVFRWKDDVWADALRCIGEGLGSFIYLVDAMDDFEQDKRRRRFNPLTELHGQPDYFDTMRQALTLSAAQAADAVESLPLEQDVALIRNVVYSGVWVRFEQLLAKSQKKEKQA